MKKVTLIHTVKSVLNMFEDMAAAVCGSDISFDNIYDSFLADDPDELGYVSPACKRKLYQDIGSAMDNRPDVVVVTCSAMTETVRQIRPFMDIPLIAIDENMIHEAVRQGSRIRVLATAVSSAATTEKTLLEAGGGVGKKSQVVSPDNQKAFDALQSGDKALHDALVLEQAEQVKGFDLVVLAQASMAHLEEEIADMVKVPVLSSPSLCMQELKTVLDNVKKTKVHTLDHAAFFAEDVPWFVEFFENVFGMAVADTDPGEGDNPRQVWMDGGIQIIRKDRIQPDQMIRDISQSGHDILLAHIALSVPDMDQVLAKAYSYDEIREMPQGRNWIRLPDGICIEILD